MASFQVRLGSTWADYAPSEDSLLKIAFVAGSELCKLTLDGASYECDFKRMVQKNIASGKERKIRAPPGLKPSVAASATGGGIANVTVPSKNSSYPVNDGDEKIAVVVPEGGGVANVTVPSKNSSYPVNDRDEKIAAVVPEGVVVGGSAKKSWTIKQKAVAGAAAGALGAAAVGGAMAGAYAAGRDAADGDAPSGADHCHDGSYYVPPGCDGPYYTPPVCDGPYYTPPVCDGPYYVPPVCDGSYYVPPPSPPVFCEPVPVPPPVESACGVPGEDYAEPCEPCCEDGFDAGDAGGFEDGADLDAESGEAVADLITCVF